MNNLDKEAIDAFNCAINILAVEYLIKTYDYDKYCKLCDKVYALDNDDLLTLHLRLSFNMHMKNLGEMITQGDYDYQREDLMEFLNKEE